jgi:hypothetical protein
MGRERREENDEELKEAGVAERVDDENRKDRRGHRDCHDE